MLLYCYCLLPRIGPASGLLLPIGSSGAAAVGLAWLQGPGRCAADATAAADLTVPALAAGLLFMRPERPGRLGFNAWVGKHSPTMDNKVLRFSDFIFNVQSDPRSIQICPYTS